MDLFHTYARKYFVKVVGMDTVILVQDNLYFMQLKDIAQKDKAKLDDLKTRFGNSQIAGGAFGLALILSLRRYFPNTFGTMNVNKFILEMLILTGSLFSSSISVMLGSSSYLHDLKKEYIIKADPGIYNHMKDFREKYLVDEESQVRYLLSNEEFQEWKKVRYNPDFLRI